MEEILEDNGGVETKVGRFVLIVDGGQAVA